MTIKTKMIILLVTPLIGVTFFGTMVYRSDSEKVHHLDNMRTLTELAIRIGSTVHETQKERGLTAGYLSSEGKKFAAELPAQHQEADGRIAELKRYVEQLDTHAFPPGMRESLTQSMDQLGKIGAVRDRVMSRDMDVREAVGFYTAMHAGFLNGLAWGTQESTDGPLASSNVAYVAFLMGKERAGIERAVLSVAFANDSFSEQGYDRFIELLTEQSAYLEQFMLYAGEEDKNYFKSKMSAGAVAEVERMRRIARDKGLAGGFGVDAGEWFAQATQRIEVLRDIENHLNHNLEGAVSVRHSAAVHEEVLVACVVTAVILLTGIGGWLVIRSITRKINDSVQKVGLVARGDLTATFDERGRDELAQLGSSFNSTLENLRGLIAQVRGAGSDVAAAATEISASSDQMASSLNEQSAQVIQISSAIEEMSASVIEVARNSSDAADEAKRSGQVATDGGQVVEQTIEGINAISAAVSAGAESVASLGRRGEQIGQIIEVINDIADQTNLLALNAAIEAARAGEHGRGFAVVADEVRKLADRTTKATDEIAESIQAIQDETGQAVGRMNTGTKQVAEGVRSANEAGDNLRAIVTSANHVAGMIQTIASAAEEQSAASEQVSRSVESVSSLARQSNEGARQSAAAAMQLSEKAESLQALIERFKIEA